MTDPLSAGAISMGFFIAGLFFLRFWRDTRDRLFAFFSLAFVVLAVNRAGASYFYPEIGDRGDHLYWVRFFAFLVILLAIIDKNRSRRPSTPRPPEARVS
jgi:predicted permease